MTPADTDIEAGSKPIELGGGPASASSLIRLTLGPALMGLFVIVSQSRTGVGFGELIKFGSYWILVLLVPGRFVSRRLVGRSDNVVEALAVSAATGVSLELIAWTVGTLSGTSAYTRFWWIPCLIIGITAPSVRRTALERCREAVPALHMGALSGLAVLVLMRLDVAGFRRAPLPPLGGSMNQDFWWHLSVVQELMRVGRPQIPQVVGEPLNYHFMAHVHISNAASTTGIDPEVLLLRLWIVPITIATVGLAYALGRRLTSSSVAGLITAWLGVALELRSYLWVDIAPFGPTIVEYTSPSQVLANVGLLATALGATIFLANRPDWRIAVWLAVVVVAMSGSKSTFVPLVLAGTVFAAVRAVAKKSDRARPLMIASVGLLAIQGVILLSASGTSGGRIILLGTLKSLPAYRDLVTDPNYRAVNSGLVLDSVDSPRTALIAAGVLIVFFAAHSVRLAGLWSLTKLAESGDLIRWWLGGAVIAGFGTAIIVDHFGLSQIYFVLSAAPLGAALTVAAVWIDHSVISGPTRRTLLRSAGVGATLTLALTYAIGRRRGISEYGPLDRLLFPGVLLLGFIAGVTVWWLRRGRMSEVALSSCVIACLIGVAIPSEVSQAAEHAYRWVGSIEYPNDAESVDFLTTGELEAMLWLRSNSDANDVTLTNVHCRPVEQGPLCDARGFWVVGLSGRRSVLEGWGYTPEAQQLQGVENRVWATQPSPFVERAVLNEAVFDSDDVEALQTLATRHSADWVIAVHRAGRVPQFQSGVATVAFTNGEVTIYSIAAS